jgi:succinate dehydrogenase flavin-adding protein (antitoxin of CptAB toxin-antitoxin module)
MYRVPMTNAYMHRYAVRQAIKDGYKTKTEILQRANEIIETQSLDAKFMEQARKDGEYVTFQRELKGIGAWANKLRTGNTRGAAVTQMLVPFFNTAGNLFKYTLEHTPLNVFMKDFRQGLVEAFSREGAGSRKLATEVGKISTGLGTMYLLNEFLVENAMGNLTGDWSDMSAEERNMRTVDGQQEYALKLADGNWVSYRGFEPMSSYLTLIEALQRTEEDAYASDENIKKYGNMVKDVTFELGKSFAENPFLAGTGDLFKAMHGRKDWLDFLFNFGAGMTVPGTYRQWLSVVDPVRTKRFKLADYDENTNYIEILESQAESVLPWFIEGSNLPALDPFGNEIPKPDPVGGLLAWRETQPKNDPVYKEIQEIYFDQGKGFKPASAFFTSSDLAKIKLTPNEHHALIQASGQELYNFLSKIVQTEEYQKIPPAIRRKKINEMKEKYINTYRKLLFTKDLAVPSAIMKAKEISGEFQTPEDRENYLKEMRSQIPPRTVDEILNEYMQ